MNNNNCDICHSNEYAYFKKDNGRKIKYKVGPFLQKHPDKIKPMLECIEGHELVAVKQSKTGTIAHFRHKSTSCNNEWHKKWQSYFNNTEVFYPKITDSIKNRYADVSINNWIVEFQHSNIKKKDVNERAYDYECYGKKIKWVIDGSKHIDIIPPMVKDVNNYVLKFTKKW